MTAFFPGLFPRGTQIVTECRDLSGVREARSVVPARGCDDTADRARL